MSPLVSCQVCIRRLPGSDPEGRRFSDKRQKRDSAAYLKTLVDGEGGGTRLSERPGGKEKEPEGRFLYTS